MTSAELLAAGYITFDHKYAVYMPTHKAMREHIDGDLPIEWELLVMRCRALTREKSQEATDGGLA